MPVPAPENPAAQRNQLQEEVADLFRQRDSAVSNEFSDIQSQLQSVIQKQIRQYPPGEWEAAQERHKAKRMAAQLKREAEFKRVAQAEEAWNLHVKALRRGAVKFEGRVKLQISETLTLLLNAGPELRLTPGLLAGRLVLKDASARDDDDPGYLAAVKLNASLTLQEGVEWAAKSFFSMHDIGGLERLAGEAGAAPELRFWDEMNEGERRSVMERCLLPPLKLQDDQGIYYDLRIAGKSFTVACRCLSWFASLFLSDDGLALLCRVDRLTAQSSGKSPEDVPVRDLLPTRIGIRHFPALKLLDDVLSEEVELDALPASERLARWERSSGITDQ